MTVSAWALGAARRETDGLRKSGCSTSSNSSGRAASRRPTTEALEQCQRGYRNMREAAWNDISKGMRARNPPMNDDEEQMRCFWRQWNQRMGGIA